MFYAQNLVAIIVFSATFQVLTPLYPATILFGFNLSTHKCFEVVYYNTTTTSSTIYSQDLKWISKAKGCLEVKIEPTGFRQGW